MNPTQESLAIALRDLLDWCAGGDIPDDMYQQGRAALEAHYADQLAEEDAAVELQGDLSYSEEQIAKAQR